MASAATQAQRDLDALENDLKNDRFDDVRFAQRLGRLKVLAREPSNAPCVYDVEGLRILARIAFEQERNNGKGQASSLEAARIIANALLLQDRTQQLFADLGHIDSLVTFYSRGNADHEFVGARILFLLTYKSNVDFEYLIQDRQLLDHVEIHLSSHASQIAAETSTSSPMQDMALIETLKLVYNVATKCESLADRFAELVPGLLRITGGTRLPSKPLNPPLMQLLNALGIIEWPKSLSTTSAVDSGLDKVAKRLVDVIEKSMSTLTTTQLESALIAPLTVLRKTAMLSVEHVNHFLRIVLLPRDEERDKPLGKTQSLASRLLQLQSSAGVMVLPEAISGLLFELSDRDAFKFVRNIGYGHAAGYLMTHQIPVPEGLATGANGISTTQANDEINPVTGQRLDAEPPNRETEMTEEEKEREAQRLFVLFERLRATGVVNVENPMTAAQQSGRFEELSDSEPD